MPRGPNGEWRPADPIACAVHVMKIGHGRDRGDTRGAAAPGPGCGQPAGEPRGEGPRRENDARGTSR